MTDRYEPHCDCLGGHCSMLPDPNGRWCRADEGWQTMETAPKGEPKSYGSGPVILGVICRDWGSIFQIVNYHYHKNGKTGAWKGPHGVWEPDFWMLLPEPPTHITTEADHD